MNIKSKRWQQITLASIFFILAPVTILAESSEDEFNAKTSKMLEKSWWNQGRMIETLALKKSQRLVIDKLATDYLLSKKQFQSSNKKPQEAFIAALIANDMDAANSADSTLRKNFIATASAQRQLKIQVLQTLDDAQREMLVDEFPKTIKRAWLSPSRGR